MGVPYEFVLKTEEEILLWLWLFVSNVVVEFILWREGDITVTLRIMHSHLSQFISNTIL